MNWNGDPRAGRRFRLGSEAWIAPMTGVLAIGGTTSLALSTAEAPGWAVGFAIGVTVAAPIAATWVAVQTRKRWLVPARSLVQQLDSRAEGGTGGQIAAPLRIGRDAHPTLHALTRWIESVGAVGSRFGARSSPPIPIPERGVLSRSGMFDPPSELDRHEGSSQRYAAKEMVGRLDPQSLRWTDASPALQTFLGAGLDRLRRLSILDLFHADDRIPAARKLKDAAGRGEILGLIYRVSTLGGDRKAVELNVSTRYDADGSAVYLRCHVTDVTERLRARREERRRTRELLRLNEELRKTNRALAELKDRYSDLYQNAPAMYFSLDCEGRVLVCNDTLLRTLGYERRNLIGRRYETLLPEELRPSFRARFAQFLEAGRIETESRWLTHDGRSLDVFVTAVAVRDAEGRLSHSRSVAQDITTRKQLEAELRRNNDRLAKINDELYRKNKELDEFSHVISHDLQEPVRTLIAFSEFLNQDYGDQLDQQAREYLTYLSEASLRMRTLIRDLLELSRAGRSASEFKPVPLDDLMASLRIDYAELIRSRGASVVVTTPLPTVWGDPIRLGQLLGNLICNGLKYNESESPRVEVGTLEEPMAGDSGRVTLSIRDNGIGIDPQFHEAIFQMFRRLHPRGRYEGSGAGLAICQKIARSHGAKLWVESRPASGSTFFVDLPRAPVVSRVASTTPERCDASEITPASDNTLHVR